MNKLYNNRFMFIVCFSIVFIMVLAFGSFALVKKHTLEFKDAGYIISSNKVLNFGTGTTYRLNLNEQIVFTNNEGKIYEVDQSSFIHYHDGSIALLKNGAFVDLKGISESIVPYYNITKKSLINYREGGYTIKNGNYELYFDDILLRVNENKFLIAGKDVSIKVPGIDNLLSGQYFELTFIEDGILLIENNEDSYQVTADGTIVYIGDKTIIDMSTKNVFYEGESRLNMTQITIDGNENITIVPDEEEETGGSGSDGSGHGSGGSGSGGSGQGSGGSNTGGGSGSGGGTGSDSGSSGGDEKPSSNEEISIELVSLLVDVESMTAILQVNNPLKMTGKLEILVTNAQTNEVITPTHNLTQTGYLSVFTDELKNDSTYMLTVKEIRENNEIEYIQRLFTTNDFGISLKKTMIADTEINYNVVFSDDSKVEEVIAELYDRDGNLIEDSQKVLTKENNVINYINLSSNTTYTIKLVSYRINSVTYLNNNGYLNLTVKTLKKKPTYMSLGIESNNDQSIFNLSVNGLNDPDSSITKYTYYIYEGQYNAETSLPIGEPIETSSPTLSAKVGEYGIEANKNYRFKTLIEYHDNEKSGEIETEISNTFISSGVSVTFIQDDEYEFQEGSGLTHYTAIIGEITLQDPDCTIPIEGRACMKDLGIEYTGKNDFSVSYYVDGVKKYKSVTFEPTDDESIFKVKDFMISNLSPGTEYTMQLNGDVYEGGTIVSQAVIGNTFLGKTDDVETLKIEKTSDNESTFEYPLNANITLTANTSDKTFINAVETMNVTLYALDNSNNKVQIGDIITLNNKQIIDLFYNKEYQMTNTFFEISDFEELLSVASNGTWVYQNYIVEFNEAYVGDMPVVIENNEIPMTISKVFLLDYYANTREATTVKVTELKNRQLEEPIDKIDGQTVAAYKINATLYIEDILRQYYGVTGADNLINWDYIYYIIGFKDEVQEDGTKIKVPYTLYTSEKTKYTNHTFYLDDENIEGFDRGDLYQFGFQIVVSDGLYPSEPVIAVDDNGKDTFNPIKESPSIAMATWSSTENSITFMYKITKDVDNALYENNLFIYDANGQLIDTQPIEKSSEYQYVTFNNLTMDSIYTIYYNKANNALDDGYAKNSKGGFYFDGYYDINSSYTLKYEDVGNQLGVIINDDVMLNRSAAFSVKVAGSSKEKEFVFTSRDLVDCNNTGINSCLMISYQDLEEYQGMSTTVSVKAYYDNGLVGLDQQSIYYIFKNDIDKNYLTITDKGTAVSRNQYPDGVYTFERTDMDITIKNNISNYSWNSDLPGANFKLSISSAGVGYSNYGNYDPKVIKDVDLTTDNNIFFFSSIIPMVNTNHSHKINSVTIDVTQSGLTKTIVENEYRSDDRKIYIDLFEDDTYTRSTTLSVDLDLEDLSKTMSFKFDNLLPDHTYYYQIYSYILNSSGDYERTELYDYRDDGVFEVRTKSISTMNASEIFADVDLTYESVSSEDRYLNRRVEVTTSLIDIDNYKLKYIVKDSEGNDVFSPREITEINETIVFTYNISENSFVFGENGYTLTITAITTDINESELVLYDGTFIPHLKGDESITELRNPTFSIINAQSYVPSGSNSYAIKFIVAVNDLDLVIINADYYVKVTDDYGNTFTPVGYTLDADGFIHLNIMTGINQELIYTGLDADSFYSITVKAPIYRNNASLEEKYGDAYGYDYIETGSEYNLKLGTGELTVLDNLLTVTYKNASNLSNITKIIATVRKDNALVGTYEYVNSEINFTNNAGIWSLNIDLKNIATVLNSDDNIRLIIRYYANNLDGEEGLVDTITYSNYNVE